MKITDNSYYHWDQIHKYDIMCIMLTRLSSVKNREYERSAVEIQNIMANEKLSSLLHQIQPKYCCSD